VNRYASHVTLAVVFVTASGLYAQSAPPKPPSRQIFDGPSRTWLRQVRIAAYPLTISNADAIVRQAEASGVYGIEVDNGQHVLLGAYRQTLALVADVHRPSNANQLFHRLPLTLRPFGGRRRGGFEFTAWKAPSPFHIAAAFPSERTFDRRGHESTAHAARLRDVRSRRFCRHVLAIRRTALCPEHIQRNSHAACRHCRLAVRADSRIRIPVARMDALTD